MEDIKKTILDILRKYSFDKTIIDKATEDSNITKDLKINSARVVDVILDVEEIYDIEIDDKSLSKIATIKDVIELIKSKTS